MNREECIAAINKFKEDTKQFEFITMGRIYNLEGRRIQILAIDLAKDIIKYRDLLIEELQRISDGQNGRLLNVLIIFSAALKKFQDKFKLELVRFVGYEKLKNYEPPSGY